MPLCGTDSGRAVLGKPVVQTKRRHPWVASLIREGSDQLERGRVWGNHRFLPHMERSGSPRRSGRHLAMPNALAAKEKGTFRCPFLLVMAVTLDQPGRVCKFRKKEKARSASGSRPLPGGAEDGTRTHTPKYWLLRPERLPFRHFRLFHFGPAHSQNSRPTSTRIIPFLALACQFPGLSPPFGGCLSTGVVLG